MTDVAWGALAQPTAAAAGDAADDDPADDDPVGDDAADEAAAAPAEEEAVTEPHPATAEHSHTASTVPRT